MEGYWEFTCCHSANVRFKNISSYVLDTKTIMLTGGDFGIESSVISLIEFVIVLIIALYLIKKR